MSAVGITRVFVAASLAATLAAVSADTLCTTPSQRANPDYTFSVDLATPAVIDQESLSIELVHVQDGRCPIATCFHPGQTAITLQVAKHGGDAETITLTPEAQYDIYCFGVASIFPPPRSPEHIAPEEYRITVDISKLSP